MEAVLRRPLVPAADGMGEHAVVQLEAVHRAAGQFPEPDPAVGGRR